MTDHDDPLARVRASIDALRDQAKQLAEPFLAAGRTPNAGEEERIVAETARLILENAATEARLIPAADLGKQLRALEEWGRERNAKTLLDALEIFGDGTVPIVEALESATDKALSDLEALGVGYSLWMESYAVRAWAGACDRLALLGRPEGGRVQDVSTATH